MNYLKIYIKLIRNAKSRDSLECYFEKHHIFPLSIFGKNNKVVSLTAREHYIAHALLEKIYIKRYGMKCPATYKMIKAFFMMNTVEGIGQERYKNSRLYESNKIRYINSISGENSPLYGKKRTFTEQHLANMRESKAKSSGINSPLFGVPRTEETKEKMRKPKHSKHGNLVSEARKGMKFTEEHRENMSKSHKGPRPWMKGKKYSEELREKLSKSALNKNKDYITQEYKEKLSKAVKESWIKRREKLTKDNSNVAG